MEIMNIKENELPSIINGKIEKYEELDKSIEESIKRAEEAKENADTARKESAGFFNRENAIEAVQKSGFANAEAIVALVDSQKKSFEFQTKLADISKYLLNLGGNNTKLNQITIRQLQLKVEGDKEGTKLSEVTKSEMRNVIRQLEAQGDILKKQENLEDEIKHSRKQSEINFETLKQELNEIKEITDVFKNKFPLFKKIVFLICGITGITLLLSIISLILCVS